MEPIIGKKFDFEESPEAFDYVHSGQCVGKVVITVSKYDDSCQKSMIGVLKAMKTQQG